VDCVIQERRQICATTDESRLSGSAGLSGFENKDFLTRAWIWADRNLKGKAMVHIGRISRDYLENELDILNQGSPHNILPGHGCLKSSARTGFFHIYHYAGSEEQRHFRDSVDPRGAYSDGIGRPGNPDPRKCERSPVGDIQGWLKGFASKVGEKEARRLLDGVGQIDSWPKYEEVIA